MNKFNFSAIALILGVLLFTSTFAQTTATAEAQSVVSQASEAKILIDYLEANGDFINSEKVPSMIKSKEVFENLANPKYLVIDLRSAEDFAKGHISKAKNVPMKNVIDYFDTKIKPGEYDKITFVCYSGQTAAYTTAILRMLGYHNVFAMKWGMSSWNNAFATKWETNLSSDFVSKLETTSNPKNEPSALPTLAVGSNDPKVILKARAKEALSIDYKTILLKPAELFDNGSNYYIINYWPTPKYDAGHIPGAIQYAPKKSISTKADILTIPTDKKVAVYCFTGQHSAFVVAYLKLLGYDAYSLGFGSNSFMHQMLIDKGAEEWNAFTPAEIHDYKFDVDTKPTGKPSTKPAAKPGTKPANKNKQQESSGGCG